MNISGLINSSKIDDDDINNPTEEEDIFNNEEVNTLVANNNYIQYEKEQYKQLLKKQIEEIKELQINNDNIEKLANHRIKYSWFIFWFVCIFFIYSLTIVLLNGFKIITISDTVLGILLGTNTADVIGVLFIVAKWLYPQEIKQSRKPKKK